MHLNQQAKKAHATHSTTSLNNKKSKFFQRLFSRKTRCVYPGLVVCVVSALILISLQGPSTFLNKSNGFWLSPTKGQAVHDIVHLAAYTRFATPDNFKVDHVIFTAWWTGVDPAHWVNLCSVSTRDIRNIFQCDGNLRLLQARAGNVIISFDAYDSHNHVKLAPNGGFAITYSPSSPSQ